ncbi:MAG: flagellin N-methylase [Anaerocolumna sp.]|jgi:Fe-S-cluster containining protein|nr:flagellin N-methylase [Anaerocolumna sp.]
MNCRIGCGACCIAPSISSPIPGMPEGKPAGVRCIQLTSDNKCKIFGSDTRPKVCESLMPTNEICGINTQEALDFWDTLESLTKG